MKSYSVEVWFGVHKTNIVLTAGNVSHAIVIAKRIYPNAKVVSAKVVS